MPFDVITNPTPPACARSGYKRTGFATLAVDNTDCHAGRHAEGEDFSFRIEIMLDLAMPVLRAEYAGYLAKTDITTEIMNFLGAMDSHTRKLYVTCEVPRITPAFVKDTPNEALLTVHVVTVRMREDELFGKIAMLKAKFQPFCPLWERNLWAASVVVRILPTEPAKLPPGLRTRLARANLLWEQQPA